MDKNKKLIEMKYDYKDNDYLELINSINLIKNKLCVN